MSFAPVIALLVCGVCLVDAVNLGQTCSTSEDCTATDSYCEREFKECNGKCTCYKGYQEDGEDTCKLVRSYNDDCSASTNVCAVDTTCTGSPLQCKCATGMEYNSNLWKCVATGEKEVGATCTNNTGCYMGSSVSECVADEGTTDPKYCRCRSGYLTTTSKECRTPTYDETCTTDVGCESVISNSEDESQVNAVCTQTSPDSESYKCSCPEGAEMISTTIKQVVYNVCLTTHNGTQTALGDECTTSNSCDGKLCALCPHAEARICASAAPVVLNQPCSTNADCTAAVANSYCHMEFSKCNIGRCKCSDGYHEFDDVDACKPKRIYGQECTWTIEDCPSDTFCSEIEQQCKCADGEEYNTMLAKCVLTGAKGAGETCNDQLGCYGNTSSSECVANTGTTAPKYCHCRKGYFSQLNGECRKAIYGEPCSLEVGCDSLLSFPDDTSQVDVVCAPESTGNTSYKCSCPAASEKFPTAVNGQTYSVCLKNYRGVLKNGNDTCTESNSCKSKLCMKCMPNDDTICAPGTASGYETMRSTVGVLLGIVILSFLDRLFFK